MQGQYLLQIENQITKQWFSEVLSEPLLKHYILSLTIHRDKPTTTVPEANNSIIKIKKILFFLYLFWDKRKIYIDLENYIEVSEYLYSLYCNLLNSLKNEDKT